MPPLLPVQSQLRQDFKKKDDGLQALGLESFHCKSARYKCGKMFLSDRLWSFIFFSNDYLDFKKKKHGGFHNYNHPNKHKGFPQNVPTTSLSGPRWHLGNTRCIAESWPSGRRAPNPMDLHDVDLGGEMVKRQEKNGPKNCHGKKHGKRRSNIHVLIYLFALYIYIYAYIFWRSVYISINCVVLCIVYCVLMHYSLFHNIRFI